MPQINYRCSEILIFLAFEELWLWPSAKSSLIHLLQYAVQTWLFSTCATIEESLRLCMAFKALQSCPHPSLPAWPLTDPLKCSTIHTPWTTHSFLKPFAFSLLCFVPCFLHLVYFSSSPAQWIFYDPLNARANVISFPCEIIRNLSSLNWFLFPLCLLRRLPPNALVIFFLVL